MKKVLILLTLAGFVALSACSRKTCPAYSSTPKAPATAQNV